jgi:hypothetical protein
MTIFGTLALIGWLAFFASMLWAFDNSLQDCRGGKQQAAR